MGYVVTYHPDVAKRDLPGIPGNQRKRIQRAIEERLMTEPGKFAERLRKDLAGSWKLRAGEYRVVFDLSAEKKTIYILVIAHRRSVYGQVIRRRS